MNVPASRMPAIFFGHGNPMFAIQENDWTRAWAELGRSLPRPKAILMISAHWYTNGTGVTAMSAPRTIHDFGGFPQALFDVRYPAPGDPALARRVGELLAPLEVQQDQEWGIDHGTWAVLSKVFPAADIPVIQLSIDARQAAQFHFDVGRALAPLRDEGVLIAGSGNVVHNLRSFMAGGARGGPAVPHDWAERFNSHIRSALERGDLQAAVDYEQHADARMSVPTAEHYLPLLYVLGTRQDDEPVSIPVDGIDAASISMMSVVVGKA